MGTPDAATSPTLLLVLEELGRTDGGALVKRAVKELIARGVFAAETIEVPRRRLRGARQRVVLFDGAASVPSVGVLDTVARMVREAPEEVLGMRVGRDLAAVARHLARQPDVRRRLPRLALAELVEAGLVVREERRRLVLVRVTVHARTPAGEAVLARGRDGRRRRGAGGGDGDAGMHASSGTDGGHDGVDAGWDSSFDTSFDSSFDASFDSAFDASFDSGFSSADGGGGDGGGGH